MKLVRMKPATQHLHSITPDVPSGARAVAVPVAAALLLVAAAAFALTGCSRSVGQSTAGPARAAPPAAQVTVAEVVHRPLRDWSEFTGRLEAVQSVEIRPRVGGYIDRIAFQEGTRVRKGEILLRIDPRPFRAEVERQAAARTRALAQLDLAKTNHARAQRLIGTTPFRAKSSNGCPAAKPSRPAIWRRQMPPSAQPTSTWSSRKSVRPSMAAYPAPSSPRVTS